MNKQKKITILDIMHFYHKNEDKFKTDNGAVMFRYNKYDDCIFVTMRFNADDPLIEVGSISNDLYFQSKFFRKMHNIRDMQKYTTVEITRENIAFVVLIMIGSILRNRAKTFELMSSITKSVSNNLPSIPIYFFD